MDAAPPPSVACERNSLGGADMCVCAVNMYVLLSRVCFQALVHPELEVVAITTVYGNADVDQVNINVAKVLEYMGREVGD